MLTPEAGDALTRLKRSIEGKDRVHEWQGRRLKVSSAEVNPRDVVDLCNSLPTHPRTQSLLSGSINALASFPQIRSVVLHVVDIAHLIVEAEKLLAPIISAITETDTPAVTPPPAVVDVATPETPTASPVPAAAVDVP